MAQLPSGEDGRGPPSSAMEVFAKKDDKECMRLAMLNHEKTFREQVNELHRLYRVQKLLMRDMKKNADFRRSWEAENKKERGRRALDLERPAEEYADDEGDAEIEEESEIELTLATGSRSRKKEETSLTSESTGSFSSSSAESGGDNNPKFNDWSSPLIAGMNGSSRHPSWLYQCLSLNIA